MIHQTIGFRFHPTDEEMLLLLRHKAQGNTINPKLSAMIVERDFYSENGTPWIIFKQDDPWQTMVTESGKLIKDTKYLYVITRLKKISAYTNNIIRSAGCGTWDGQTGKNYIKDKNKIIGFKKMFHFKPKIVEGNNNYGKWIMHEYHLDGDFLKGISQTNDFVICRIKWEFCSNDSNGVSETPLLNSSSSSVSETAATSSESVIKNVGNLENINNESFPGFDDLINIEEIINGDEGKFGEKEIYFIEKVGHILTEEEDGEWGKFMIGTRSSKRLNNSDSYFDSWNPNSKDVEIVKRKRT
ncbi:hypothetical protein M9H77_24492 [Catharanthus roseus]|uniref:Uncharacterized protein n=1 Tax=Catharanthus roseus TaxID=4058 RepID=A0ACC0AWB8_CATRO|nr:hypothetical protein M9H77_24492 [Catharanthus roseus]